MISDQTAKLNFYFRNLNSNYKFTKQQHYLQHVPLCIVPSARSQPFATPDISHGKFCRHPTIEIFNLSPSISESVNCRLRHALQSSLFLLPEASVVLPTGHIWHIHGVEPEQPPPASFRYVPWLHTQSTPDSGMQKAPGYADSTSGNRHNAVVIVNNTLRLGTGLSPDELAGSSIASLALTFLYLSRNFNKFNIC